MARINCWEAKSCGREPGGTAAEELGVCPAALPGRFDGANRGCHGGRICWAVAGTLCGGKVQGSYAQKLSSCLDCEFLRRVQAEEDREFLLTRGQIEEKLRQKA